MGASGAGKSTLLNVLNGTDKPTEGEVLINGINMHRFPERIEGIIGFVPQDDLLIEELTVYQNLYYAARLCFSHLREEETEFLVEKTLDDLGLTETRDLTVGNPLKKTISGGQRKRLNIGLELLREPAVLFVDEPTSGLSSRDSENIIDLLKELSLKGKLVFAVIHQPSSDIFKMFDKLVILDTGGYQIYYGNPVDAIPYFKKSVSMLDSHQGECIECGNVNPEQIFNIIESKVINEFGNFSNERKISPQEWNSRFLERTRRPAMKRATASLVSSLNIPGWFSQVRLFFARDLTGKLHNTQYLVINLLEAPLLAFLLAFIVRYHNIDDKLLPGYVFSKNLNLPAYLFMSVIVALFMGLTVSAEEIFRDRKILKRESFLHLSRGSYLVSKVLILFMISSIQTLSFVLVGNLILGIKGMVLTHWLLLFTSSCMANLLGLNISAAFNSAVTIYILIPILLIPQLILSGVVVKFDKLNPVIGNSATVPAVGDLMASRWAFEAAMVAQFKDNRFERQFYPYDKAMAESDYKRIYYIPDLESRLDFCLLNYRTENPVIREKVNSDLSLIQKELGRENNVVDAPRFGDPEVLSPARFDTATYRIVGEHLTNLKRFYGNRFNRAENLKERLIGTMTGSAEGEDSFELMKEAYQNETIAAMVKNLEEQHRIIEKDGRLIQKIYPIYKDPEPEHMIDFDAQFYMPAKHFLNRNIDTLFFNAGVIWSMTLFMYLTLYFDVLRKLLELPHRFRRR
jgi:ABC-type multidrug transport system ATPase subunit